MKQINITVKILKGYFPKRQLKLILAWAEIHKDELMQNWELARNHEALYRIAPLTLGVIENGIYARGYTSYTYR